MTVATSSRKTLFVINPHGGGGRALSFFKKELAPRLQAAKVAYDLLETQHAHHAAEIGETVDPSTYHTIVCVSGDGMFHQLFNGVWKQHDRGSPILDTVSFGIVPSGTGNGLATSVGSLAAQQDRFVQSLVERSAISMDALVVRTSRRNDSPAEIISVLSITWGIIADHDTLTEVKYRWMGPKLATTLAPIKIILKGKIYRGTIRFQLADSKAGNLHVSGTKEIKVLPDDWREMSGAFHGVIVCNTSHIATNCHMAPQAQINDGLMDVILINGPLSTWELTSILLDLEEGAHVNRNAVDYFKVRAVNIIPEQPDGKEMMAVDGELIPAQALEIRPVPSITKIISPNLLTSNSTKG